MRRNLKPVRKENDMKIIIEAEPKEIAALEAQTQELRYTEKELTDAVIRKFSQAFAPSANCGIS